jgi:hypothetical protein
MIVVREIMRAHTVVTGTTDFARSIFSAVSCHHFHEEMLS